MEHRLGELNVTKVPGAVFMSTVAAHTLVLALSGAHARVGKTL